ncbi:MAG: adenine deaminase [Methanothrix sp.]
MAVREELIAAARGEVEVDLLLAGGRLANVLSGEVYPADVAIHRGRIVGFECSSAGRVLELDGQIIAPGFIDGHVHIESSMVTVPEYARAVVPRGTTTVVADPHELANVWGTEGIRYILDSSEEVPLNVYVMLPSCVPATDLETAGASLRAEDLAPLMQDDRVLGLAEMMNYPGVLLRDAEVMAKLALAEGRPVDGHAPGLSGRDLSAYIAAGIGSDHECTTIEEAREKVRSGMHIMLREGSAAKNLRDLLPLVTPANVGRFLFVSDDRHPADLLGQGHIDFMVRTAVEQGLEPILALQIASINAARYFGLPHLGAIVPGYRADLVVLDGLESLRVAKVIKDGTLVAEDGRLCVPLRAAGGADLRRMNIAPLGPGSFAIMAQPGPARVIGVVDGQIVTRSLSLPPKIKDGLVVSDTERDILKMAVVERHRGTGNVGLGLVQGFGLARGAIATSVAHDSHNIAVVGVSDEDMLAAVRKVAEMGGGLVALADGVVQARLPLPVAGLMSEARLEEVEQGLGECIAAARGLGCRLSDPFMTLSFLCLPVIPELKLTDRGLVDVNVFRFVPLFLEKS